MKESTKVLMVARNIVSSYGWSKYHDARNKNRKPTEDLLGEKVTAVSMSGAVKMAISLTSLKNRPRTERRVIAKIQNLIKNDVTFWLEGNDADEKTYGYMCMEAFNDSVAKSKIDIIDVFDAILHDDGAIRLVPEQGVKARLRQRYGFSA
jgi:hypothetical protein